MRRISVVRASRRTCMKWTTYLIFLCLAAFFVRQIANLSKEKDALESSIRKLSEQYELELSDVKRQLVKLEKEIKVSNSEEVTERREGSIVRQKNFQKIYKNNMWGGWVREEDGVYVPGAGGGSTVEVTEAIRKVLLGLIRKYDITSLLDAPCGDMNWMPLLLREVPHVTYHGIDIVPEVVQRNIERFANESNWSFSCRDLSVDRLPAFDLILCRDATQHMVPETALATLRNFDKSGSKYVLTTSYEYSKNDYNRERTDDDIHIMNYWNLERHPFNVTNIVDRFYDSERKTLLLIKTPLWGSKSQQ
mmetsp:Transcript_4988/g.7735  ORF Transcript_4988/g.7735 Transcript_4988/m.7735 type:complete len:306 (-) Transcript_4988:617-1534(-)